MLFSRRFPRILAFCKCGFENWCQLPVKYTYLSRNRYFYRTCVCIPAFWMPRLKTLSWFSATCSLHLHVLIKSCCLRDWRNCYDFQQHVVYLLNVLIKFCCLWMFWSSLAACAHSSLCLRRATSGGGWSSCQGPCEYYYSGLRENASWNNAPEPRFWTV